MITATMIVYIICIIGAYFIFDKYLIVIDKTTGQKLDTRNLKVYLFLLISKICFSLAWIISLPLLYYKANKS